MKVFLKPIYEIITGEFILFEDIVGNYIAMGIIGIIAFGVAWKLVGKLYDNQIISGKILGSIIHWTLRLISFVVIFYISVFLVWVIKNIKMILLIALGILACIVGYKILKKLRKDTKYREVINKIKKGMSNIKLSKYTSIFLLGLIPLLCVFCFDRFDCLSKIGLMNNITTQYDWLSFIGAYISILISSILVIKTTNDDRKENREILRESQRPLLNTRIYFPNNFKIFEPGLNGYMFFENEKREVRKKYVVKVFNSGETTANIDVNNSYIQIDWYDEIKKEEVTNKKIFLKNYEDRIHIASKKEMNLILMENSLYNENVNEKTYIKEVYIEYSDLFGKKYKDHIKLDGRKIKVITDNELIG